MQKMKELLVNLDRETLRYLPCYCDKIDLITFRIGNENVGPVITFKPINSDNYDLLVRNIAGKQITFSLSKNSNEFIQCQDIAHKIRVLVSNDEYKESLTVIDNVEAFNGNLVRLTDPIFI
jgi:hypothetical protein